MSRMLPALIGALLMAGALQATAQDKGTAKKLYCWDEAGRRVCGDALPASAVDSAREELSGRSGLRVGGVDRALTAEERDARDVELKRLEAEAQNAEAALRRDIALAASYETEEELRRAYGLRYDLIDESIKSSQLALGNLHSSLLRLLEQAGERELAGKPVVPALAGNIREQRDSYVDLQAGYRKQQAERAAIDAQLQQAVARYREMKHPEADKAPPATLPATPPADKTVTSQG